MNRFLQRHLLVLAFAFAGLTALLFAIYTNHVWEDFYITYRSSKNLATGNGLVFNAGDRLHTFTSPLGVLLPALASLLTFNSSDTAALWIFRAMCLGALGTSVALLVALARRLAYPAMATLFLVTLVATDAKVLDYTINGMETAFMLLFLAYALWAHHAPGTRQWLHLGGAWAGLMWTRPDSFIYIGLVAGAAWLFNDAARTGHTRRQLLGLYFRAGLLTCLIYLPWLVWATWYYGTPIPHTIVAKGAQSGGLGAFARLCDGSWQMPWLIWQGKAAAAEGVFAPSYYMFPSWPAWMVPYGRTLATICALLWLVPKARAEVRVASFAFFGGVAYLSFVPYFPFPWYFPSVFLLATLALAGAGAQLWGSSQRWLRLAVTGLAVVMLTGGVALTAGTARQVKAQQIHVEDGLRRRIGEWLKAHSRPGDSVFMEPLGYIGFFSGLKTHDWPGMSSRELTSAKLLVGTNWADLITYLQPTWLVLRPQGEGDLPHLSPQLHESSYELVQEFSQLPAIQQLDIPGRKLLEFDGRFRIYRLKQPTRHDTDGLEIASPFTPSVRHIANQEVRLVHAPGIMIMPVPAGAKTVTGQFGFPPDAYDGHDATDGATFRIHWSDGRRRVELGSWHLAPAANPADRGLHAYQLSLPPAKEGAAVRLSFSTDPSGTASRDWTCWTRPVINP